MMIFEIFAGFILLGTAGIVRRWRIPLLFIFCMLGVFLLQPDLPIGLLQGVFPAASILLVIAVWGVIHQTGNGFFPLVIGTAAAALVSGLNSYEHGVVVTVVGGGAAMGILSVAGNDLAVRKRAAGFLILAMAAGLLLLKTPPAAEFFSQLLRANLNLDISTAQPTDLQWLGISYLALRLISVLIEFREDRLPELTFAQMTVYALFPASLVAGPIDRVERFQADVQAAHPLDSARLMDAAQRIGSGIIKKFVIADTLAWVALSPAIAADTRGVAGAWVVVYVYALRLYFDFSGYSDIAIGLGKLAGIDLPENFNYPYLRQNLTRFWQNWHMSLTDWFRAYCFLPFSRYLLRKKLPISDYFAAQIVTMLLIGLWHGATVNFVLWGLWHAVGLYVHRVWSRYTRGWYTRMQQNTWTRRLVYVCGVMLTFHYVAVGWVFFALPDPAMSAEHLKRMFGLG